MGFVKRKMVHSVKAMNKSAQALCSQHYLALSAPRLLVQRTGVLYDASAAVSPKACDAQSPGLSSTAESPGRLGRGSLGKVGAFSGCPAPGGAGGAAAPKLGLGRRSGSTSTSPTFSGQEAGRPRAFPVVQLKPAETSPRSHSLGCQRPGGPKFSPFLGGRPGLPGTARTPAPGAAREPLLRLPGSAQPGLARPLVLLLLPWSEGKGVGFQVLRGSSFLAQVSFLNFSRNFPQDDFFSSRIIFK